MSRFEVVTNGDEEVVPEVQGSSRFETLPSEEAPATSSRFQVVEEGAEVPLEAPVTPVERVEEPKQGNALNRVMDFFWKDQERLGPGYVEEHVVTDSNKMSNIADETVRAEVASAIDEREIEPHLDWAYDAMQSNPEKYTGQTLAQVARDRAQFEKMRIAGQVAAETVAAVATGGATVVPRMLAMGATSASSGAVMDFLSDYSDEITTWGVAKDFVIGAAPEAIFGTFTKFMDRMNVVNKVTLEMNRIGRNKAALDAELTAKNLVEPISREDLVMREAYKVGDTATIKDVDDAIKSLNKQKDLAEGGSYSASVNTASKDVTNPELKGLMEEGRTGYEKVGDFLNPTGPAARKGRFETLVDVAEAVQSGKPAKDVIADAAESTANYYKKKGGQIAGFTSRGSEKAEAQAMVRHRGPVILKSNDAMTYDEKGFMELYDLTQGGKLMGPNLKKVEAKVDELTFKIENDPNLNDRKAERLLEVLDDAVTDVNLKAKGHTLASIAKDYGPSTLAGNLVDLGSLGVVPAARKLNAALYKRTKKKSLEAQLKALKGDPDFISRYDKFVAGGYNAEMATTRALFDYAGVSYEE